MDGHQNLAAARDQPRLLDQVRGVIRRLHYSIRTEQTYVDWIRRFILFHGKRHPAEMGAPEVEAFLSHLAVLVFTREEARALLAPLDRTKGRGDAQDANAYRVRSTTR